MKFSAVICTYNPDRALLKKVLHALLTQNFERRHLEIILVDNNSSEPVSSFDFVKEQAAIYCIVERQQGLAHARIAGIKAATADHVVFVDDDNILHIDYLKNLEKLFESYNAVAVWGPGIISVNYTEGVPDWIKKNYSSLFQEKKKTRLQYGCVAGWPDYYPAGSGLAVRKNVLLNYIGQFESGKLTASGRKGNSLASAEDSQIVWTAVKMGLAAGTCPTLSLEHHIPKKRLSRTYLANLNYGIASSYKAALYETFPELKNSIPVRGVLHKFNFILKMLLKSRGNPAAFRRFYSVENAWFKGLGH